MKTNEELKKEFIEGACEWISKHAANYVMMEYNEFHHDCDYEGYNVEKLTKDFRKAMEANPKMMYEIRYHETGNHYKTQKFFSTKEDAEKALVGKNDPEIIEHELH